MTPLARFLQHGLVGSGRREESDPFGKILLGLTILALAAIAVAKIWEL